MIAHSVDNEPLVLVAFFPKSLIVMAESNHFVVITHADDKSTAFSIEESSNCLDDW
jgi:hypothetical protein